ncbi:hypothetical protein RQP46_007428 [Phenoliferia psychrophenolica]
MATTFVHDLLSNATTYLAPPAHALYEGVDKSNLNALELAWMSWYEMFDSPVLATGVMSFLLHEIVYFGRCIPFMIMDNMKFFRKWKLQPNKLPSAADQWKCTKAVLLVHFTVELPQIYAFEPMARSTGMATWEVPFPSLTTMALQIALFFIVEDTWHYWVHRLAHHRLLYKHVHKVHHEYAAPFGLAAEYAHPAEVLTLGAGTVLAPLVYCWLSSGNLHIITMYTWIVLRLFQAIDSHSGYQFPWSLNNFFLLWSGADHHDYHHEKFRDNYASSFRHWDWLVGTDKAFHAHRARQQAERTEQERLDREGKKLKAN